MYRLTETEQIKVHEITQRLANLSSPVLRLQAILQFSQIVDMLALGDTYADNHRRYSELDEEVVRLTDELRELKGETE
jgi:uncharacterized small protein (DUF1192 family)